MHRKSEHLSPKNTSILFKDVNFSAKFLFKFLAKYKEPQGTVTVEKGISPFGV